MTLSQVASLFNVSSVFVVLLISTWVSRRYSRPFFDQWVLAYLVGALLMTLELVSGLADHPVMLTVIELGLIPTTAWFYFQTGNHLRGKPLGLRAYALIAGLLFVVGAGLLLTTHAAPVALAPSLTALTLALIYVGVMIIRHLRMTVSPQGSWALGLSVIILGALPLTYPVFKPLHLDWVGFWISGVLHMLVGSGMIVFLLEDFSDQLKQQNQKLLELDELKSHFVSTVSHELRTPLTSIVGYLELLEDGVGGHLSLTQRGYIETMRTSADHLSGLVDSILDSMRLQRGALTVRLEPVDLYPVIETTLDTLFALAERGELRLESSLAEALPEVLADGTRVIQVLNNLVGNAIKFTPAGGRVIIAAVRAGDFVRIDVTDTGIGIASDQIERIFEPFIQVDATLTRNYGGTGLGLAIVRDMVTEMHGTVGCTSQPGVGSTFWFTLPVQQAARAPAATPLVS